MSGRKEKAKWRGRLDTGIYFDENDKEVYNEDFHTFHDMLLEGQPLAPPPNVKRTEVCMTHLLISTPES